jgi:hypothetical protein
MNTRMLLACFVIGLSLTGSLRAHPDHEAPRLMTGSVVSFADGALRLDTLDRAAMQRKTLTIVVDEKTKWRLDKKRVASIDLIAGQRIDVVVATDHLPDDSIRLRAMQIDVKRPKPRG